MRDRILEWRRNRQRPPGLNSVEDADAFAKAIARTAGLADELTQEIPVVAPESGPDPAPVARALCSRCRRPVKLRRDGTVAAHRGCDGGGREPLALAECEVCAPLEPPVYAETVHALGHPSLTWPEAA
jgi:hypothetical protein